MTERGRRSLDEFLGDVLRGAAKILGCNSTNLLVINDKTREIRVRVGVMAVSSPVVAELEAAIGESFRGLVAPLDGAAGSLMMQVWCDNSLRETCSLTELVGDAIAAPVRIELERMIGENRFLVVPARGSTRSYGVLLFTKEGCAPFSRQQREVILRTARRIGSIFENDLLGQRLSRPAVEGPAPTLENQLQQLSVGEPVPALFLDPALRITSLNEPAEKLFARPGVELLGSSVAALVREPERLVQLLNQQALYPNSSPHEDAAVVVHGDGSLAPARIEGLLLADDHDRVVGFLVLVRQRDDAPRWTDEWLLQQERLATMGEMAAQLAHEIRNPLLAIGATLESLCPDEHDAGRRSMLEAASREIARLDMVLGKYLSPRAALRLAPVDLRDLLLDARRLLEGAGRLDGKCIELRSDAALSIEADGDALRHVFFNLLLNALEASPAGGQVEVHAETDERDMVVLVEDRGPGLSATAEECFRPFFTTKPQGTGLGLPVCQKIVSAHGGALQLLERPGGGCQARLVLPRRGYPASAGGAR